ncbi:MAG TPA: 3',5'-cyclic-nucleotide phosphodiesterase, partial [Flavobacteriaceae bacterium]|nr:3',5'-cyclic-nucleotide phosphodiesterase [Flavobacteriaceae bacterium]
KPILGIYTYKRYRDGEQFKVEGTSLKAQIFELSHINPYKSAALLVTNSVGESLLYFGDTGADRIEKTDKLEKIWTAVAPLIKDNSLKAILIETSFDNSRKDELLFGHLTPKLLNEELQVLAEKARQKDLAGLKVIITHLKPDGNQIEKIKKQYKNHNPTNVEFLYPEQGKLMRL